ncbi:DUF1919 domain-containing protein [Maribacter sp. R77961]|uniref:DUF1919 domain-containing protein n=1 Tax=Maribacter sp. R77961 TaxID=3093871 RepID=UPI0037C9B155
MLQRLEIFLKRKIRHAFSSYYQNKDISRLKNKEFVLISRNCWGGQVYQWLGLPYNTPFVGLFLFGPCYMKLLNDFDRYMKLDLKFCEISKYPEAYNDYPIGVLDDIEIHFQHYESPEEATEKWSRRKERMLKFKNKDNYFFSICDRRRVTDDDITAFHKLDFKNKISFSFKKLKGLSNREHIKFIQDLSKKKGAPPNGKKRFKLSFLYFDIVNYLNTYSITRTRFKQ